ncbi:hypothetical protein CMO91_03900 [Candidatus Woesearchaeota archaeon]|jgi:hypothetical protein|nr:hypothetical protein [Candidatus Woesearchaeota archaeon]|tara:strand:+ start:954 stop:1259 length:306 start_codon:yes stop_codon:yes gene_type:complete
MTNEFLEFCRTPLGRYVGIGILLYGTFTGAGNLFRGILEGVNTKTTRVQYEMDPFAEDAHQATLKVIDRHLTVHGQQMSGKEISDVLKSASVPSLEAEAPE